MNITLIIIFSVLGFILLMCIIGMVYGLPWLVKEYPKEWEREEDEELKRKFDEYYKNKGD